MDKISFLKKENVCADCEIKKCLDEHISRSSDDME